VKRLDAHAKINLSLIVGPLRDDGKHEVVTVLERVSIADTVALAAGERLSISGFADDTIVTESLHALAALAGAEPRWEVEIEKVIPVAAGLGGGSSDAAAALLLANELLAEPLDPRQLADLAASIGADVPFFLRTEPQLGRGDGTVLSPVALPTDYWVLLVVPSHVVKTSTGDVYRAFDDRDGAYGFAERRDALLAALAAVSHPHDLARLPPNDLASSPLSERLRDEGAFRADVSGAGPCVYGLFDDREQAEAAGRTVRSEGQTWVVSPVRQADAIGPAISTVEA
jgi:4-diphosphocytidyl-2-C-methyl-D-erythritol kinase